MSNAAYPLDRTAYLLRRSLQRFPVRRRQDLALLEPIANQVGLLDNLRSLDRTVRALDIQVVIVPHRRWEQCDYETPGSPQPTQCKIQHMHHFARGEWGGE